MRKETLPINAIRYCLVHRNGIVSALDVRKDPSGMPALHYMELVTFLMKIRRRKKKWEHKINAIITNQISLVPRVKTLTFSLNSRVVLAICMDLTFTCVQLSINCISPYCLYLSKITKHD